MSEQQIAKLAGSLTEHQQHFSAMSVEDRQWAIQNTTLAIGFFAEAVKNRNAKTTNLDPFWVTLNPTTIAVNLAASPKLPFDGAKIESHIGDGWAVVEKKADGLYVNGRKVVLRLSRRQMKGKSLKGYDLREELTGKPVLNANLLDALADNPHLIPEEWKKDKNGNDRYVFFWGTVYRSPDDRQFVRCLYFGGGAWSRRYGWLSYDWRGYDPAASLASN